MLPSVFAHKEIQQKRLQICTSCEFVKIIPIVKIAKCGACGCPIRSKVAVDTANCPKGKW